MTLLTPPATSTDATAVQTLPALLFAAAERHAGRTALEEGGRTIDYAALPEEVLAITRGLMALGVQAGDRVAIWAPNCIDWVLVALGLQCAGAMLVPLNTRMKGAEAADILARSGTRLLFVQGQFLGVDYPAMLAPCRPTSLEQVVSLGEAPSAAADFDLAELLARGAKTPLTAALNRAQSVRAEDLSDLLYTSGTTGKPKGCVWTHVSFLGSMVTRDMHICADFKSSDRFFFMSDMGWMVGAMCACIPSYFGGSLLVAEGTPDFPDTGRFWRLVQDHKVTYLGVAPTLIRSLMRYGDEEVQRYDLSSLRITCSGGEAWTEAPWRWFFKHICKEKLPFLNIVGGTEVGGCNFTGTLHHPLRPGSFGARGLGAGVDIVDESGEPVGAGQVGELVLRNPNIGFTKSLWRDDERYLDSYWRTIAGVWVHGDFAMRDADGLFYILGRSDDTIKVSGKRTGPSEIETLLTGTGKVSEAAVIGVPDEIKGSAIVCVCVPMPGVAADAALKAELSQAVVHGMGASYRPRQVLLVSDLPKTRNMKIMRRVVRALYKGDSPGDLSSLVNPETVAELQGKLAKA